MTKKTKTKAWVKGLIAVAVIAVVGALGYYGANGELFQGRSFKLAQPSAEKVQTDQNRLTPMDRVNRLETINVDGVEESILKKVADEPAGSVGKLKMSLEKVCSDLTVGDSDVNIMEIQLENPGEKAILVSELSILEEGAGINDYELFLGREKVNTSVSVDRVYIDKLGKEVSRITFSFEKSVKLLSKHTEKFTIKGNVNKAADFVSYSLDQIRTDKGIEINNNYSFEKTWIKAGKAI